MGNLLTDKYSEGYVDHRFYAGCENVDAIEAEATRLLCEIFSCDHAYVQPHSGSDANLVAFWSILVHQVENKEVEKLGAKKIDELSAEDYEKVRLLMTQQTVMGLSLGSGGHLTHGYRHNVSGKMMRPVYYDVDSETGFINYDTIAATAQKEKPTIIIGGYSAYPRHIDFARMRDIADSVGAIFLVDMAHFAGLVAGKAFKGVNNPIPYAHFVTSTTHKTLRGPRGGLVLCKKEFASTVNKGCPIVLGGPLPHVMAAKAIAFQEANTVDFQSYAQHVIDNAQALAEQLIKNGIALATGGTDNHLVVADMRKFGITGRQAETALKHAKLTVNRNCIPHDPNGPWYTSGIRLGTPAMTTLGMGKEEMKEIANIITDVLSNTKPCIVEKTGKPSKAKVLTDEGILKRSHERVVDLLQRHPLYPEIMI